MTSSLIFPRLTFFCELNSAELKLLFAKNQVIDELKQLDAHVSLGLLDFSGERAEVIKLLNNSGIHVHAWLLLPTDQGYWFNLDNAPQALTLYMEFKQWSADNGLTWYAVGLDIEPDIRSIRAFKTGFSHGIMSFAQQLRRSRNLKVARNIYISLVDTIKSDGYRVESYQFPIIVDERAAGSRLIQSLTGIIDLPVEREVLMLYSSFHRPRGQQLLVSYASSADAIGLGVTGGGVDIEGIVDTRPLDWKELKRDLLVSARYTPNIYIFSLEGCVEQDFLEKITRLDWAQPSPAVSKQPNPIMIARRLLKGFLWFSARPLAWITVLSALVTIYLVLKWRKNRFKEDR